MKAGIYKTPNGNLIYVAKDRTIKATSLRPSSWPGMKVSHRAKDDTVSFLDYRCTRVSDVPNGCTDHQALVDTLYRTSQLQPGETLVDAGTATERVERSAVAPKIGEIIIEFESGMSWRLRDDAEGYTRVVTCGPLHAHSWLGGIVHNADNLVRGLTDIAHVSIPPSERSFDVGCRVVRAFRFPATGGVVDHMLAVDRQYKKLAEKLRGAAYSRSKVIEAEEAQLVEFGFRFCHGKSARKHRRRGDAVIGLGDGRFAWRRMEPDA